MSKLTLPLLLCTLSFGSPVLAQGEPPPPPPPVGEPVPPPPPPAGAEPAAAPPPAPPPAQQQYAYPAAPQEAADTSAHRHDGFYLRIGLGFGGMTLDRDASRKNTAGSQEFNGKSKVQGGGGAFELSIGGTVGSGLVICGTLYTQSVVEPELEPEDGDAVELGGNLNFLLLGPGIHWYPSPTGGFHFGATLGLAAAVAKTPDNSVFENLGGAGGGLSLAVGYDFWIADQWSLGGMLRLTGASLHGEATEGNIDAEEDDTLSAVSLMFTALHH